MERGSLVNILSSKYRALIVAVFMSIAIGVLALAPKFYSVEAGQSDLVGPVDSAVPQVVFTNPANITINASGAGNPYPSNITVSGVSGTVSKVTVTLTNASHTWPDDVGVLLVGPTGLKVRLMTDCGGPNATVVPAGGEMTNVTLTFDDAAANSLPEGFNTPNIITTGTWKPTLCSLDGTNDGAPHAANFAGAAPAGPYGLSAFNGVNPNGTWSLFVDDDTAGDFGSIAGGWSIDITTAGPPVVLQKPNVDMNGDGKSDFVIIREGVSAITGVASNTGALNTTVRQRLRRDINNMKASGASLGGSGVSIDWWGAYQDTFGTFVSQWGDAQNDWITPADFDGDDKDDIAVWRPGAPAEAAFYWIRSSDSTFSGSVFGQGGDNPTIVGDYDADGIDDPAVFRCPDSVAGQCYFYYQGSDNNPTGGISVISWGFGSFDDNFVPNPGDFDGDGKFDFCFQRENPNAPGQGQFALLRSSDLQAEYIYWGLFLDIVVPGDFDGDGRSDFAVTRPTGGQLVHYVLERDGGTAVAYWGLSSDILAPGDYDGDGKQDVAIYRWTSPSAKSVFWILRSSDGQIQTVEWGVQGDIPAAGWNVQQ